MKHRKTTKKKTAATADAPATAADRLLARQRFLMARALRKRRRAKSGQ